MATYGFAGGGPTPNDHISTRLVFEGYKSVSKLGSLGNILVVPADADLNGMFIVLSLRSGGCRLCHMSCRDYTHCIKTKNLKLGRALHAHLIKTAQILDTFFTNRLIQIYSRCSSLASAGKAFDDLSLKNTHSWNTMISAYSEAGWFETARHLLDKMPEPNLVTYNSIISNLSRNGFSREAVNLFSGVQKKNFGVIFMDEFTVVGLAHASANLAALEILRQVHALALVMGLDFNRVVCNALIDSYGKCGVPESSYRLFSRMEERDVVSWTSMVVAYARSCRLDDSCRIFDRMPFKNSVSWTALLTGLAQNGEGERALSYFRKMMHEKTVAANDVTYVSALSACADLAAIGRGKQIHCRLVRTKNVTIFGKVFLVNALIDMYGKCGDMKSSMRLFERIQVKDVVTWNSLINSFAQNGQGEESLAVFEKMLRENVKPNDVTFIGVMSACSHSGLESEGLWYYEMMVKKFGIVPHSDHYAIIVDLLGRKNRLNKALEIIEKAPEGFERVGMWGALLASSHVHGNVELANKAAEALFKLEPENSGRYVILSNIYANAGRWEDARGVRRVMNEMELKKDVGCSWIDFRDVRYVFVAEGELRPEMEVIREVILNLVSQMKDDDGFINSTLGVY
ncbi:pentatricopeptide repeat-containing protein [Striga asiatica]|uniref:Pentatricopeptide repeat-containing protein n=1 Tax=Striga asiatica TaxID=4170 RepID=A0A5A7PR85_STRAF|nr:pentatricopeptide repeat-containing protein [Striga asiatica]